MFMSRQNANPLNLEQAVDSTSLSALVLALRQAETFYISAAHHLCDYRSVIEIFEDLAGEFRRCRAELSVCVGEERSSRREISEAAFDFTKVAGGGSSLVVIEAERGTQVLLHRYELCLNYTQDAVQKEILGRHRLVLMQVKAELTELKLTLYKGESIDMK